MEEVSKSEGERTPARARKTIASRLPHEDFVVLRDLALKSNVSLDHLVTSVLSGLASALREPPRRGRKRRSTGPLPPHDESSDENSENSP